MSLIRFFLISLQSQLYYNIYFKSSRAHFFVLFFFYIFLSGILATPVLLCKSFSFIILLFFPCHWPLLTVTLQRLICFFCSLSPSLHLSFPSPTRRNSCEFCSPGFSLCLWFPYISQYCQSWSIHYVEPPYFTSFRRLQLEVFKDIENSVIYSP